ncbi:transesterase [Xylaria sp. CBS 124048]|nr:transesterase [Xylaria sp. CBS 124048]
MEQVDKAFQKAVRDGRIHGAVLLAKDLTGKVNISRSYGVRTLSEKDPEKRAPMLAETPMRIASCSKLITSIMVLQCVELGLLNLDETADRLLPEIASLKVLERFDEAGNPIGREAKSPILLKHLLTHSSGLVYAMISPTLQEYYKWKGQSSSDFHQTVEENYTHPLLFDPGTSWAYGPGLDWSSRLIEKVSGMRTEEFMQKHIVNPLGIKPSSLTFEPVSYPEMQECRADVVYHDGDILTLRSGDEGRKYEDDGYWFKKVEAHGGEGVFATPASYMAVLWSILSNDGKLLKPETRELLFEPVLTTEEEEGMNKFMNTFSSFSTPVPSEIRSSHSLAGRILLEDIDGDRWRQEGNLSWSGYTNLFWSIDRKAGLCSLWAFHSQPYADPVSIDLGKKFEKETFLMLKQ